MGSAAEYESTALEEAVSRQYEESFNYSSRAGEKAVLMRKGSSVSGRLRAKRWELACEGGNAICVARSDLQAPEICPGDDIGRKAQ